MSRMVLLDTNLLIGAFDGEADNPLHEIAKQRLRSLLNDPNVKVAITPLIRFEVLRGAKHVPLSELDAVLNDFQEFEVRGVDARWAAELFQQARIQDLSLDKRSFDLFHCVCADLNGLELESQDGDIPKIQQLIQSSKKNAQA
jgi:predicted nucleic acid-binding protein